MVKSSMKGRRGRKNKHDVLAVADLLIAFDGCMETWSGTRSLTETFILDLQKRVNVRKNDLSQKRMRQVEEKWAPKKKAFITSLLLECI